MACIGSVMDSNSQKLIDVQKQPEEKKKGT